MARSVLRDPRWARFLIVGGVCFSVNLVVLYAGTDLLGVHYLWATLASLWITNTLGWLLNRRWTFASRAPAAFAEYCRYLTVNLSSFALGMALMALLVGLLGIHYLVANACIAFAMALGNFLAHRSWSFSSGGQSDSRS